MNFKDNIRIIPDFPEPGIRFKDITTLLKDGAVFHQAIDALCAAYAEEQIDLVVGPEARGFAVGAPVAYRLGAGFVPVRKPGKLPAETLRYEYTLEYGKDALEIHRDAIIPGQRVLIVDDLLATGGTTEATIRMVEQLGGKVVGLAFLIELSYLNGRNRLKDYRIVSLAVY
ncbi:adenine phosphoribosyltransferase [Thermosinus carboxydivorans Nor1]|uniref:Adenine phosphoribosyltransferase n=1 Tax=Thermosinus carboxydivorans Nor1 TaxID=401526 RepID=A1HT93_9FIRM|nr:adenine phosphoribosyltransferase [Thermosinus carboxydivorans]EAX46771.1 adenine phosphoribosyltransferase [Thermosinus carboxydivorans Nor1]